MKHKYTIHFTGDEIEFRNSLKWKGKDYAIEKVVFSKSYFWIAKYKILKYIADFGYWVGRKADKLREDNYK